MTQMDKPEIESLLSSYIDGELSERQCNEVKRLLQHDQQVAEMLKDMQKQKDLLNALEVDSAPATMLDDIKASLERNMLLDRRGQEITAVEDSKGVFTRRVLAAAAMLLLPIGLLAVVIFSIITPSSTGPTVAVNVNQDSTAPVVNIESAVSDVTAGIFPEHFNAVLQLVSSEPAAVNNFIEKAVYSNGLADNTVSGNKDSAKTYRISSVPTLITALLRDMETVWVKCRTNRFMVYDEQLRPAAVVANITASQVQSVFEQSAPLERIALAKVFAGINPGVGIFEGSVEFDPSIPIKPVLTGPEKPTVSDEQVQGGETITLIIIVSGL